MKKIQIAQILLIIFFVAIIFYNLGVSYVIKHQVPRAVSGGYEIEVFGNVFYYATEEET